MKTPYRYMAAAPSPRVARPPGARGQALVLMSLSLLMLTLMVFLSLSLSLRVREKMEAQSVADLAAYSSAVATARTFNSLALMNRAQAGQMIALTSAVSLVSYASMVRASLLAVSTSLKGCAPPEVSEALDQANANTRLDWENLDSAAGIQALNIQNLALHLKYMEDTLFTNLYEDVEGGPNSYANRLAQRAMEGSSTPTELRGAPTMVSHDEVFHAWQGYGWFLDHTMGSRGYSFVTERDVVPLNVTNATQGPFAAFIKGGGQITAKPVGGAGGSTYFGDTPAGQTPGHGGSTGAKQRATDFLIAEDHAEVTVSYPGCPTQTMPAFATVRATDGYEHTDDHYWTAGGVKDEDPGKNKEYRHTLIDCWNPKYCPNVFISAYGYNSDDDSPTNLWAQPKLFAYVQRDYKVRQAAGGLKEPWLLHFNFSFSPSRTSRFDNRGLTTADGTDISVQGALGTGLAYYHRRLHWNEPPNFWNPFWRATLVSADVDDSSQADIASTVGPTAAQAYDALMKAGYLGVH